MTLQNITYTTYTSVIYLLYTGYTGYTQKKVGEAIDPPQLGNNSLQVRH